MIYNSGNFKAGANPVGALIPGARNFQQSVARNRGSGPAQNALSNFGYGAGWGVPTITADGGFGVADYEFQLMQGGVGPVANPIITGVGAVQSVILLASSGGIRGGIGQGSWDNNPSYNTWYYFKSGASATLQYTDILKPGKWQINLFASGNSNTSGNIDFYAGSTLLGSMNGTQPNQAKTVQFQSSSFFSIRIVQSGMTGNFSSASWKKYIETSFVGGAITDETVASGSGVTPVGMNCGAGPDWDIAFLYLDYLDIPNGIITKASIFSQLTFPSPIPGCDVQIGGQLTA